jgi:PAS domain S-box-containing protein
MSSTDTHPPGIGRPVEGLPEGEARFIRLAENSSDIIFRYRHKPTRGFDYVNPAVTAITGYTPEEYYANPDLAQSVVHPEDRHLLEAATSAATSLPPSLTFRVVRKDGGIVWVERRVIHILDEANEIVALEGIVRDITQRVLTQQTLEQLVEDRTREIERRRQVAESLRETLAVLNSERSAAEILDHIVGQALALLGADAAAIYGIDQPAQILRIRSARGLDPDYVANMEIPVGTAPVGEAVAYRRPVAVADLRKGIQEVSNKLDPRKRALLDVLLSQYAALAAVPLIVKGEAYGGLVVYYRTPREFSHEELALTAALGDQAALTIENARLRAHLQEAAAAAERNRLARDLHDSVSQTLFSVNLIAGVVPRLWERNPEEGRRRLAELRQLARGALAEMRTLLLELRPAALLEMQLGDLLQQLAEATTGHSRLPIVVTAEGQGTIPPDIQMALYRIAQEALNNVVKHAEATSSTLTVRWSPSYANLVISDDGQGFDPMRVPQAHFGLEIMRERADGIGAALSVNTRAEGGTIVEVNWTANTAVKG